MPQIMSHASTLGWTLLLTALSIGLYMLSGLVMFASTLILPIFGGLAANIQAQDVSTNVMNADWHAPNQTEINDLNMVIDGTGVYGFIFNNSHASAGNEYYGGYNWCNMPHVNAETYVEASEAYTLEYVEVVNPDSSNASINR